VGFNFPNGIIQNNTFIYSTPATGLFSYISNAVIQNNIFYNCNPSNGVSNSTYDNNITYSTAGPLPILGGSNIDNTDPLFVNITNYYAFGVANNYNLQVGSPAINAGADATDIGYYGGSSVINLSPRGEIYNMPQVRKMQIINTNVPQNGNVNVKVRSTKSRTN
jgi:hypothetical protein